MDGWLSRSPIRVSRQVPVGVVGVEANVEPSRIARERRPVRAVDVHSAGGNRGSDDAIVGELAVVDICLEVLRTEAVQRRDVVELVADHERRGRGWLACKAGSRAEAEDLIRRRVVRVCVADRPARPGLAAETEVAPGIPPGCSVVRLEIPKAPVPLLRRLDRGRAWLEPRPKRGLPGAKQGS